MQNVINEIRSKVSEGEVIGVVIVDGQYVTLSEETLFGRYRIGFFLGANDTLDFSSRITFHNEDGGFDVSETAEELLDASFNWWVEIAERV
ncbi:hypothetical protein [Paenibacillus tyrfis]|uniref:hypothetical protein n=1 Tax=Paenibacillus tyrfis TaxID=1501230 RepID=UPI000B590C99|nr:hypothetical protein [Paenibacillus tyrfis]